MASWRATRAKAQFSALLDTVEAEGPQVVERRKKRFLLLTEAQWQERSLATAVGQSFVSAWDALTPSFEERYDVEFPRLKGRPRRVDLG